MKKLLSICFCLMLCLTSVLVLGACKMKPKSVSEEQANVVLTTAMSNMESETAVKMYSRNFMFMGEFLTIATPTVTYMKTEGIESWTKQEGGYFYQYAITTFQIEDEDPITEYTKSLVIEESDDMGEGDILSELLGQFEGSQFAEASFLDGEYTISFTVVEDGVTVKITFIIEDEELEEITISAQDISMSLEFEFGEDAVEEIPNLPTNVTWNEYEPYIEVDGIETEFVVGDTLDLTNATIEYYEDIEALWSEGFELTMDMISGFDTTTVGTRTMTVTFYGLTYEIEYTVTAA